MLATARLVDVALVSFAVDPARLRAHLPAGVDVDLVPGLDGAAFVSVVAFTARRLRLAHLPFPPIDCGHVDYRAYVSVDGKPAVWFLGAAMDSALSGVVRRLWHMPWHRAEIAVRAHGDGGYEVDVRDGIAEIDIRAGATSVADIVCPPDFLDRIVNPCVGYFMGRRGRLMRYAVRHEPLRPSPATPVRVDVGLFADLGLVEPGAAPHSFLRLPDFDIEIVLPPRAAG